MDRLEGKILITGGAGYLGRAIIQRAFQEHWNCSITIFSTDAVKHGKIQLQYPVSSMIGDVRDKHTLYNAMLGKDVVIHAAAVKFIDISEFNSIDTFDINVNGSLNVLDCATRLNTPQVLGISTDKACHAANTYGASKYLMEKLFQEYSRTNPKMQFHLVRYGNGIDSTASVLEKWKASVAIREPIKLTNPKMTRFWLSPAQAVEYALQSMNLESGHIFIPVLPVLSIGKMAEFVVGEAEIKIIPVRPGEKEHETLLTSEETHYAQYLPDKCAFDLSPSTTERHESIGSVLTSDTTRRFTKSEFMALLKEAQ